MSVLHPITNQSRLITRLIIVTMIVWGMIIASLIMTRSGQVGQPDRLQGQVLPGLEDQIDAMTELRFTMADGSYALRRPDNVWTMATADSYPINAVTLAQFLTGLVGLTYQGRQTADPKKYGIIGLGSPDQGGNGVRLQIYAATQSPLVDLIIGRTPSGLYLRKDGEATSYQADGDLPPFYNQRPWLDLDIYDLEPDAIESIMAFRPGQPEVVLLPAIPPSALSQASTDTTLRGFRQIVTPARLAQSIADLTFIDVQGADRLTGPARISYEIMTANGLILALTIYSERDGPWVVLQAGSTNEQATNQAHNINRRASGWAFAISGYSFSTLNATLPQS